MLYTKVAAHKMPETYFAILRPKRQNAFLERMPSQRHHLKTKIPLKLASLLRSKPKYQ